MKGNFLIISALILSACGISKKSLVKELKTLKTEHKTLIKEHDSLNKEYKKLNNKLTILENELDKSKSKEINITPTLNNETIEITSQLSELEDYFKNDKNMYSKFASFKNGGLEKTLKVSYSEMQRIIKEAKTYIGTKYAWGGLSHNGIDCSGLLYMSFQAGGIKKIPRTAENFARYGYVVINTNKLQVGDLVFFTGTYRTTKLVTHAGIFIGNGEFIHTSSSKGVIISKINDPYYWRKKFLFGTRVIN